MLIFEELNTASKHLLSYVSGLGPVLAQNIIDYRAENGKFTSRVQLKKVPRLGGKAFEQAAGFLRIPQTVTQRFAESWKESASQEGLYKKVASRFWSRLIDSGDPATFSQ